MTFPYYFLLYGRGGGATARSDGGVCNFNPPQRWLLIAILGMLNRMKISSEWCKKHRNFSRNRPELVLKNGPKLLRIYPEIGANFAEIFFKFGAKFILKPPSILLVFGSILASKTGFFPEMSIFA